MQRVRSLERRSATEQGAVAVEFALVLPLLVMLLLGITTAGLSYTRAIGLTNAVREGARFGATAVADLPATWASDVISRVRGTQFDDPSNATEVCVQLWQKTSSGGAAVASTGSCNGSVTGVTLPTTAGERPAVPSGLPDGACVVRVVAGRTFTINIGLASWDKVNVSSAVARYERMDDDDVSGCS